MKTSRYRAIEFLAIYILIPISFALNYSIWIKLSIGLIGFVYIILVLLKVENQKFKLAKQLQWKLFWKETFLKLAIIVLLTTFFVWKTDAQTLFSVVFNKPKLWVFILFIYTFFSVYPQELVYRTFYFHRYNSFFTNKILFIFLNAILFSLAHLFFRNVLVLILTFLGGLLFAITYKKTKSTILVSIEHAIYGCWLFTVGMGEMLGFPT
ncbi:type II CAAX endopeptidase family protein [uncultured Algibacter sp.]|uniref:CPBP family intramembrane glutamic endopeptidase n=1 Tax=uncultured Algibacter sp. TaxID=298659 RepID=UPI002615C19D|nr:type II CAAX endopeptidase family protein [uncultured Algibacter sp.]